MIPKLPALPFSFLPDAAPLPLPEGLKSVLSPLGIIRPAATELDDLKLIPGNTAKAQGRPFSTWLFFRFAPDVADPAGQLRAFITACRAAKFHTSMFEQLEQWVAYKARKKALGGQVPDDDPIAMEPFGQVLLTGFSFRILGPGPGDYEQFLNFDEAFANGMTKDRSVLRDPLPGADDDTWLGHHFEEEFHVALFLAGNTRVVCDSHVKAALKLAKGCQLEEAHRENGFVWKPEGPGTAMREPFGFADGLSNLLFLQEDVAAQSADDDAAWNPVAKWNNVLFLPEASAEAKTLALAGGSFVVLRKLEQDVAAFRAWEERSVRADPDPAATAPGAQEPGAVLIGRTRTGCPITGVPASGRLNDFAFADDAKGLVCPFHAHIRKANPRGSSKPLADEATTRFVRRGMVFAPGDRLKLSDRPMIGCGVGLLFTGYMGGIIRQFRFMQGAWLLNPDFPAPGQSGHDPFTTVFPADSGRTSFVVPRGGGYFFAPPIPWAEHPL